jgi:hypothetical protein
MLSYGVCERLALHKVHTDDIAQGVLRELRLQGGPSALLR